MNYSRTRWAIYGMIFAIGVMIVLEGCASTPSLEREYARVEYIETQFKPWLESCWRSGGIPWYRGTMSRPLRKAMDNHFHTYEGVRQVDLVGFTCTRTT
jgi:hypothetical protein